MNAIKRVVVGVSGGVDSAVAAFLLKQKGFEVLGLFMTNWDENDETGVCSISRDREDARTVCKILDIPFFEINFVKKYWTSVFSYLIKEYENGFTPNPDILCNRHIKFDNFVHYALKNLNADAVATGHYALTNQGPFLEYPQSTDDIRLLTATDSFKDQTFFLCQIHRHSLKNVMFPVGGYTKDVVKEIAANHGLQMINKKRESTGICFIGHRKFQDFICDYIDPKTGPMVNLTSGQEIQTHSGIHLWTVGQRARISGAKKQYFIVKKDSTANAIYVVPGTDHPALFTQILYTEKPHWISSDHFSTGIAKCLFRFQHTKPRIPCTIYSMKTNELVVLLERPLRSITPGQFAVFYQENVCLGSAKICKSGPSLYALNKSVPLNYEEYEHHYPNGF